MMWCWMNRVVIRDAARRRGFRSGCGAPLSLEKPARAPLSKELRAGDRQRGSGYEEKADQERV